MSTTHAVYERQRRLTRLFWLLTLFGILALFFVMNFRVVVVNGNSMEPTYHPGQRLLMTNAYWLFGEIERGDVVVIIMPGGERLIKRVAALPNEPIPRRYWSVYLLRYGTTVPEGHLFVVGDNLSVSEDSRTFGPVPLSRVEGKIVGGKGELP